MAAIDHPTTRRENRSSTTARYSHPSAVQMYVVSATHLVLGSAALKSRWSRLGATCAPGSLCVVTVRCRGRRAKSPCSRIRRATRLRAQGMPCAWSSRSEEHTSELQSQFHLVCRLLLEKKK